MFEAGECEGRFEKCLGVQISVWGELVAINGVFGACPLWLCVEGKIRDN